MDGAPATSLSHNPKLLATIRRGPPPAVHGHRPLGHRRGDRPPAGAGEAAGGRRRGGRRRGRGRPPGPQLPLPPRRRPHRAPGGRPRARAQGKGAACWLSCLLGGRGRGGESFAHAGDSLVVKGEVAQRETTYSPEAHSVHRQDSAATKIRVFFLSCFYFSFLTLALALALALVRFAGRLPPHPAPCPCTSRATSWGATASG